ncbi:MAG: NUDIX hydrolase [Blastocatellia bacterium]
MPNLKLNSKEVFNCRVFTIKCENHFLEKTNSNHDFFIIEPTDWVNIIALTQNNEVILVKQYRYGTQNITLEIPGGMIDEGESAEQAAKRELLEETGYESNDWQLLGISDPNPAIQNNKCHIFLAKNSKFTKPPILDNTEEIEILSTPLREISTLIQQRVITHSLVITAFYYYHLLSLK